MGDQHEVLEREEGPKKQRRIKQGSREEWLGHQNSKKRSADQIQTENDGSIVLPKEDHVKLITVLK